MYEAEIGSGSLSGYELRDRQYRQPLQSDLHPEDDRNDLIERGFNNEEILKDLLQLRQ